MERTEKYPPPRSRFYSLTQGHPCSLRYRGNSNLVTLTEMLVSAFTCFLTLMSKKVVLHFGPHSSKFRQGCVDSLLNVNQMYSVSRLDRAFPLAKWPREELFSKGLTELVCHFHLSSLCIISTQHEAIAALRRTRRRMFLCPQLGKCSFRVLPRMAATVVRVEIDMRERELHRLSILLNMRCKKLPHLL